MDQVPIPDPNIPILYWFLYIIGFLILKFVFFNFARSLEYRFFANADEVPVPMICAIL